MKILNLASFLSLQNAALAQEITNDEKLSISAIEDYNLLNSTFLKCEVGSLNIILTLIAQECQSCQKEFLDELDSAYLYSESNLDEDDIFQIVDFLKECNLIIIDNSYENHIDRSNIESLLALISKRYNIKIININKEILNFKEKALNELKLYNSFNGVVILKIKNSKGFLGSSYFAAINNLKDGETYNIISPSININSTFKIDKNLKGTVAILNKDNKNSYIYEIAKISKV